MVERTERVAPREQLAMTCFRDSPLAVLQPWIDRPAPWELHRVLAQPDQAGEPDLESLQVHVVARSDQAVVEALARQKHELPVLRGITETVPKSS